MKIKNIHKLVLDLYNKICCLLEDGITGVGLQGPPGPRGLQGVQGIPGEQGAPGQSINPEGVIGTELDLPLTAPELTTLLAQDTGALYIYNPDCISCTFVVNRPGWVNMGVLQGPPGPQGVQGVTGLQGPQGIQGPPGTSGTNTPSISLTQAQAQTAITNSTLIPNQLYKITGVHKNRVISSVTHILYDDGNNAGIDIYLRAITTNKFEEFGTGEFYVPKYQPVSTYAATNVTGNFGILLNGNTYNIGDIVFWGGYAWLYNGGVIPTITTSTDSFELPSIIFTKLPFSNTVAYQKVFNTISYQFETDEITYRKDEYLQVTVTNKHPYTGISYVSGQRYPISAFGWNVLTTTTASNVTCINSYIETVNFLRCNNCTFITSSVFRNFGKIILSFNNFIDARISSNIFSYLNLSASTIVGTVVSSNNMLNLGINTANWNKGTFSGNTNNTSSTVNINKLTINSGSFNNNILNTVTITDTVIDTGAQFNNNTVNDSLVYGIILNPLGKVLNSSITASSLFHTNIINANCTLTITVVNSHFSDNVIDNAITVNGISITNSSSISKCYIYDEFRNISLLSSSSITHCYFYGKINFNNLTYNNKQITRTHFKDDMTVPDISTSTIIFNSTNKDVILNGVTPSIAYVTGGALLIVPITT